MKNNVATIVGKVTQFENGKGIIQCSRFSGNTDEIPFKCLDDNIKVGHRYYFEGYVGTKNHWDENLVMHKETYFMAEKAYLTFVLGDKNDVNVVGYICKKCEPRCTPLSSRTVQDIIVAVNTEDPSVSYYLSCIVWGKNTIDRVNSLPIGSKVHLHGRFQSRKYMKNDESKTAYEISIKGLHKVEDEPLCEGWYEGDCEACSMEQCMNHKGENSDGHQG